MLKIFPMFIMKDKEDFLVYIPDFREYTKGTNLEDALTMAKQHMLLLIKETKIKNEKGWVRVIRPFCDPLVSPYYG